jgi:small subunit ribosomal protein S19
MKPIKLYKRNLTISENDLGKDFLIHQGLDFLKVTIVKEMLGHKFGEYAPTRSVFKFKQKNIKKK